MEHFTASKSITCSSLQRRKNVTHLDFERAFPNAPLSRPALAELPQIVYKGVVGAIRAIRLKWSICGLKETTLIWNKSYFQEFENNGLVEMEAYPA